MRCRSTSSAARTKGRSPARRPRCRARRLFRDARIPLLRGARSTRATIAARAAVVVINQAMAERYWADGGEPLADRMHVGGGVVPEAGDEPLRQIIGIVGNVRHKGINGTRAAMYFPPRKCPTVSARIATLPMAWLVRTSVRAGDRGRRHQRRSAKRPGSRSPTSRSGGHVARVDVAAATQHVADDDIRRRRAAARRRRNLRPHRVRRAAPRQEIGIRMALGDGPGAVRKWVIRQGMLPSSPASARTLRRHTSSRRCSPPRCTASRTATSPCSSRCPPF